MKYASILTALCGLAAGACITNISVPTVDSGNPSDEDLATVRDVVSFCTMASAQNSLAPDCSSICAHVSNDLKDVCYTSHLKTKRIDVFIYPNGVGVKGS